MATPEPAAPAHRRKVVHRAEQVSAYPSIYSGGGPRYARPQAVRGTPSR